MNWKYDSVSQEYQLLYGNSALARILLVPQKKGGYIVKTLISAIYYGQKIQTKMEKQNKEWVAYKKKYKDKKEAELYIERKKIVVKKFITVRENEA